VLLIKALCGNVWTVYNLSLQSNIVGFVVHGWGEHTCCTLILSIGNTFYFRTVLPSEMKPFILWIFFCRYYWKSSSENIYCTREVTNETGKLSLVCRIGACTFEGYLLLQYDYEKRVKNVGSLFWKYRIGFKFSMGIVSVKFDLKFCSVKKQKKSSSRVKLSVVRLGFPFFCYPFEPNFIVNWDLCFVFSIYVRTDVMKICVKG